jgi:hypothetical protein
MPFPTTIGPEVITTTCRLALLLEDAFRREPRLVGPVAVRIDGQPPAWPKPQDATFLFFELPDGAYTIHVASDPLYPYYQPVDIPVTLPVADPRWPAFPDLSIADRTLRLDDPAQPAAYRAQRDRAALRPTTRYPFPVGATLVRGTVTAGGAALAAAMVAVDGGPELPYLTDADGSFVIFFEPPGAVEAPLTVRAQHAAKPDVTVAVAVRRGETTVVNIAMAP